MSMHGLDSQGATLELLLDPEFVDFLALHLLAFSTAG